MGVAPFAPRTPGSPRCVRVWTGAAQSMFNFAFAFNQPLNSWSVTSVTNMKVRLAQRASPPQRHAAPCDMRRLFPSGGISPAQRGAHVWVGAAQDMFADARAFNQPLHSWNVARVVNMGVKLTQRASPPRRHAASTFSKLRSVAEGRADVCGLLPLGQ